MRLGLDAMREACAANKNPERAAPVIHVAGTNGKGSTCAMVEAMARSAGLRTGLYTSPHLARFAERIRINGTPIDDARLADHLEVALESELSFFETATLAAFLAFREANLDVVILEVGIGGRLDATNVVRAAELRCAAVTRVALDHQDKLGDTIEKIAAEKVAIGKAGRPIVLGPSVPTPLPGATLGRVVRAKVVDELVEVGMEGPHQRENAGVAWAIAQELGIPVDARARGLAKAEWPGRFERVSEGRIAGPWILDGAHNPDGMNALVDALADAEVEVGAVVFGALADKAWPEMERVLTSRLPAPRFHAAPRGRPAAQLPDTRPLAVALAAARAAAGPERVVVICGSIYLVGEARAWLLGLPTDPPVTL
jgi:dihydrofolate synthase / folylpolyglutamate synthase